MVAEFLSEPEPLRGIPHKVAPGIIRIVAPNPSPMTYWGTNTYLIEGPEGLTVLDPGPDDAGHVQVILAVGTIRRILLSHTHSDHVDAVPALRAATGAPVYAWHDAAGEFTPDVPLQEGSVVAGWTALHTPGHAPDHLCFAGPGGVLFSADHVMAWSTSVVSPPHGSMTAYVASLDRLLARNDSLYLPGHGPPLAAPRAYVEGLRAHRLAREASILAVLGPEPVASRALTERLYANTDRRLWRAAERNVLSHLDKLAAEGRACRQGDGWLASPSAATGTAPQR